MTTTSKPVMMQPIVSLAARALNCVPPWPALIRRLPHAVVMEAITDLQHREGLMHEEIERLHEEAELEIAYLRDDVQRLADALTTRQGVA